MAEYKIEKEGKPACEHCKHGQMYMIVNSDDEGYSIMFESEEDASDLCDAMNWAFERGQRLAKSKGGESR